MAIASHALQACNGGWRDLGTAIAMVIGIGLITTKTRKLVSALLIDPVGALMETNGVAPHPISEDMLVFREAIRHVWNTYFAISASPMSPQSQEDYSQIERALLSTIVLSPLGGALEAAAYRTRPLASVIVRPATGILELPLSVGVRASNGTMQWELEKTLPVDPDTAFEFFDFFDWQPAGNVDLAYVRARIRSLKSWPEAEGKLALISNHYCQFEYHC